MSRGYTRQSLLEKVEIASKDMAVFYQQDFINYRGRTTDTNEYYTEIIAEWCCDNIGVLGAVPRITREPSYRITSHNGIPNTPASNREEELIAMAMFRQGEISGIGKVIDYQTPLKNKRTDRVGKIDLLAYDGTSLRILELKEPDSEETMLRCVLEGYTYLRTVDVKKLLSDFCLPFDTEVIACPFVFYGKAQHSEMRENRPQLIRLIRLLNSRVYYVQKINDIFTVREDDNNEIVEENRY